MLPLVLAGAIWGYNAVKIAQIAKRNRLMEQDEDEQKSLTIYKDCTFRHEDKRTYNYYHNCTFNTYIIRGGKDESE